jgi:hypothetical protein
LNRDSTPKVRPHYTLPIFIVNLELEDIIDIEDAMLLGPAWPPEIGGAPGTYYKYPFNTSWRDGLETAPAGWTSNPFYPDSDRWESEPTYDHTTRWPNDRAANVPPRPAVYGGLHLEDIPGSVPDPWDGSFGTIDGVNHTATAREGTFLYGDTDESGHFIHVYGTSEVDLLTDGPIEDGIDPLPVTTSPWIETNPGGSIHALTAVKVGSPVHAGGSTESMHLSCIGPSRGVEQSVTIIQGRQFAARLWIYMVSGQAHIQLYDNTTLAAEWRMNGPVGAWKQVTLHDWRAGSTTGILRILTGPSGGDFYVDDAGLYSDAVPWVQWGYGRMYLGRTGGYTFGGSPDEDTEFTMFATWP